MKIYRASNNAALRCCDSQAVKFNEAPVVVTPDVLEIPFEDHDDFLIVASDGLWEVTTR